LVIVAALVLAALLGACGRGGGDDGHVALDGSPRVPDVEGVVAKLADDFSTLTLEGGRTYEIPKDVQSFSTVDGSTQPLRRRVGQYVQLGLDGRTVRWVAGFSAVVDGPSGPVVYYTGTLRKAVGARLEFADGTVLRLAPGAGSVSQAVGERVLASIDPERRVVVGLAKQ
jgi:hypothetical protein